MQSGTLKAVPSKVQCIFDCIQNGEIRKIGSKDVGMVRPFMGINKSMEKIKRVLFVL